MSSLFSHPEVIVPISAKLSLTDTGAIHCTSRRVFWIFPTCSPAILIRCGA